MRRLARYPHHAAARFHRSARSAALLTTASVLALTMMGSLNGASARPLFGGANASAAVNAAVNAAIASVEQAQQATQQSMSSLSRATQAIQAMQSVQAAA